MGKVLEAMRAEVISVPVVDAEGDISMAEASSTKKEKKKSKKRKSEALEEGAAVAAADAIDEAAEEVAAEGKKLKKKKRKSEPAVSDTPGAPLSAAPPADVMDVDAAVSTKKVRLLGMTVLCFSSMLTSFTGQKGKEKTRCRRRR